MAHRIGYVGNIINYLCHLPAPFPRGLWKDLEGSSTFLPLMLLIHIDRIRLALVTCIELVSVCYLSVWVALLVLQPSAGKLGSTSPYQCSEQELHGCECTINWCRTPLGHQNGAYMGIYGYMQLYI